MPSPFRYLHSHLLFLQQQTGSWWRQESFLLTLASLSQADFVPDFRGVTFSTFSPQSAITRKLYLKSKVSCEEESHVPHPQQQQSSVVTHVEPWGPHCISVPLSRSAKLGFFLWQNQSLPLLNLHSSSRGRQVLSDAAFPPQHPTASESFKRRTWIRVGRVYTCPQLLPKCLNPCQDLQVFCPAPSQVQAFGSKSYIFN